MIHSDPIQRRKKQKKTIVPFVTVNTITTTITTKTKTKNNQGDPNTLSA